MTAQTIKDLCAPLSAKVMPKSAMVSDAGWGKTQEQAEASQRKSAANKFHVARKREKKKSEKPTKFPPDYTPPEL